MAKPIDHNLTSGAATVGWGAAKGGLVGLLAAAAVGALVAGGAVALGVAAIGAIIPGTITAASALISGPGLAAIGLASLVGAGSGVASGGVIGASAGGIIGALTGGHRVKTEEAAFHRKMERTARMEQTNRPDAQMAAAQQGYMMGFQEGQQNIVNQLRAAQEEMLKAEMAKQQAAQPPGFAAKELEKRAAAAQQPTTGKQV